MRSLIFATVLMAAVAQGFVDFNALSGEHKRSVHPVTGNIHYSHDVHHKFPHPEGEHLEGTYFKAKYAAEHEAHWNIVQLHEHIEDMTGVSCGKGKDGEVNRLHIKTPSTSLLEQVHAQKKAGYSHTIVTASSKHQCHGKGLFRRLISAEEKADGSLFLTVKAASYNDVFKNLDLHIETSHVHQNGKQVAPGSDWAKLPAAPKMPVAAPKSRAMTKQSMWGDFSSACESTVNDASSVCSDAADDVGDAADAAGDDLKAAADGVMSDMTSFNVDHTFQFKGFNYNGDVSKTFNQADVATENGEIAASFSFSPSITLKLVIDNFHLSNFETYFTGVATAGVTGTFDAKLAKTWTNRKMITTLHVDAITFSIGPVPVWLTPTVPIFAGFTANVDGSVNMKAVMSATGSVSFGYGYAPSTGHRLINTHSLQFSHDFGPLDYSADLGIQAYVEPELACTVESIATVAIGVTLQGDATVQSNNDCLLSLNFAAQPTIALNAEIKAELMGHSFFDKKFGPWTLYSTKIPLYNYCKPQSSGFKSLASEHKGSGMFARHMDKQSQVVTTTQKKLSSRHIGHTWTGSSATLQNGQMISLEYGAQFSVNPKVTNSSRLYMTLVKRMTSPFQKNGYNGELSAVASMVYEAPQMPVSGETLTYTLVQVDRVSYVATSNATVLPMNPSKTMKWTVNANDIRFTQMEADMVYGTVSFTGPKANNNTASFNIFKNGGGKMKVAGVKVDKTSVLTLMIYGGAATIGMLVAVALAVVFYRKFHSVRRSAEIAHAKDSGLIQTA